MFQQCLGKLEKSWSNHTVANLFLAVNPPKSISYLYSMFKVEELIVEECSLIIYTEFKWMYGDSGNMIYFLFFTIQFFPPCLKMTIPKHKKRKKSFSLTEKQKLILLLPLETISVPVSYFMRIVLLFLHIH